MNIDKALKIILKKNINYMFEITYEIPNTLYYLNSLKSIINQLSFDLFEFIKHLKCSKTKEKIESVNEILDLIFINIKEEKINSFLVVNFIIKEELNNLKIMTYDDCLNFDSIKIIKRNYDKIDNNKINELLKNSFYIFDLENIYYKDYKDSIFKEI